MLAKQYRHVDLKPDEVLLLRTCDPDLGSYNGFRWPTNGYVEAPDWDPEPRCGHGLHGLLRGEGDGRLLNWSKEAWWLVIKAKASDVVQIDTGKVKVPRCEVVYCGYREVATEIVKNTYPGAAVVGVILTRGSRSTLSAGSKSTLSAGDESTLSAGNWSELSAGDESTLICRYWDGSKHRTAVAVVGENGIKPNTPYRVNERGEFYELTAII